MTVTQILAWLSGPGVGVAISFLLDQWSVWKDWKPADKLGFDPKAIIVTLGSLGIGLGAYAIATNVPETTITTLDPYVKAAFPLLTLIIPQIWHALINKRLSSTTVSATAPSGGVASATAIGPTSDSIQAGIAKGS